MSKSANTRQLWSQEERLSIANVIKDGTKLEEIIPLLPKRTEAAIIREVFKTNRYSIRTMDDGTRRFFSEIKTRNRASKEKSVVVKSVQASTTTDIEDHENKQAHIVPHKVKNSGKELQMLALNFLFENDLSITDQSVRQTKKLLSQFRKEI